jgi:type III pantothenate kinase
VSGLLNGEAARIDGLLQMLFLELGYKPKVIATGGLSREISKYCNLVTKVDEDLTVDGLYIIARRN